MCQFLLYLLNQKNSNFQNGDAMPSRLVYLVANLKCLIHFRLKVRSKFQSNFGCHNLLYHQKLRVFSPHFQRNNFVGDDLVQLK